MTIAMPDSVQVSDLPGGYTAYLGYADGDRPTAGPLADRFPGARRVILTVTGQVTGAADGIDCEPGNVTAAQAALWAKSKLRASPGFRPVIYASVIGEPGYGMGDVTGNLRSLGITLSQVRLLSAHYGAGQHICGPASCKLIAFPMDGTQWTDEYWEHGMGAAVDMSALEPDFFAGQTRTETEKIVQELATVKLGSTGEPVRTAQGCLLARGYAIGVSGVLTAGVDGVFGQFTDSAVRQLQRKHGLADDGVVGPLTWPVLLGVA